MSDAQLRWGIEPRALVVAVVAGIAALALLFGVLNELRGPGAIPVEQRVLEAERDALRAYLAAVDSTGADRSALPSGDILVRIRASLIGDLIESTLPIEGELAGRYRIRVDSARVTLRTGFALVELSGRARLVRSPDVFADVWLLGAFGIGTGVEGAAASGNEVASEGGATLGGEISILGIRTRDVGVGTLSPPAERLVDELARVRLSELDRLLRRVPIPVRLDEAIQLPGVEATEVTIPAATFDVGFRLEAVRVLEDGVFVSLAVDRASSAGPARSDSIEPAAPVVDERP